MFIPLKNVPGVESQVSGEHCHGDQRATAFHHRQSVSSEVSTSGGAVTFHPWSTPHRHGHGAGGGAGEGGEDPGGAAAQVPGAAGGRGRGRGGGGGGRAAGLQAAHRQDARVDRAVRQRHQVCCPSVGFYPSNTIYSNIYCCVVILLRKLKMQMLLKYFNHQKHRFYKYIIISAESNCSKDEHPAAALAGPLLGDESRLAAAARAARDGARHGARHEQGRRGAQQPDVPQTRRQPLQEDHDQRGRHPEIKLG